MCDTTSDFGCACIETFGGPSCNVRSCPHCLLHSSYLEGDAVCFDPVRSLTEWLPTEKVAKRDLPLFCDWDFVFSGSYSSAKRVLKDSSTTSTGHKASYIPLWMPTLPSLLKLGSLQMRHTEDERCGKLLVSDFQCFRDVLTFVWNKQTVATQKNASAIVKRIVGKNLTFGP